MIMRFLADKIKTRLKNRTALQLLELQSWGLGLLCFAVMFAIRYPSVWHWDDTAYLRNISLGLPSDLLLGRPGFMYPFIALWFFVKNLGGSLYFVEDAIRISGILFLSGAYVFLFRILIALKFPVRFSFLTILFLLSEFSFSVISSRIGDSPIMYLCIAASYFYFIKAHESGRFKFLLLSSFLFGYAFLTREPALFYFPFFIVLLIYFQRRNQLFDLKSYGLGASLWLLTCISAPALLALIYGNQYLETLRFSLSNGYVKASDLPHKIQVVWSEQINVFTFPVALMGLALFFQRQGLRYFLGFAAVSLGPVAITFYFSGEEFLMEPRLFVGLFFVVAFGLAYLTEAAASFAKGKWAKPLALITASAIIMFVSFTRFLPQYRADIAKVAYFKNYYERIKPLLGKNVAVILGGETLYVAYRGRADGVGPIFISPGWSWPTGKLVEKLHIMFSSNLTVIYDPTSRGFHREKRAKDLDEMTETFDLTETKNGFIQVSPKK